MVLFRLLSAQPQTDGEHWKITGHFHNDDWHTDAYGQNPTPFYRNPFLSPPDRPPYPWRPNAGTWPATAAMNPYYAALSLQVDTSVSPTSINMFGWLPINTSTSGDAPIVPLQATTSNTGGHILPGTYYFAIANGSLVSRFVTAVVPAGTSTNVIYIDNVVWTGLSTTVQPYLGENSQRMRGASVSSYSTSTPDAFGNPTSFLFTAINADGRGLPDVNFDHFLFMARDIVHGGDWGDAVSSVGASTLTFNAAAWTTNQWAGYRISLYYSPLSGGAGTQPRLDYVVASNTATTLTLTGAHVLVAGDVVVCRMAAAHITANTIGDDNLVNSYSAGLGLTVNAETGNLIYIVSGTGAGQPAIPILSNTATVFTIQGSWLVTPDSTSVYIVIAPGYHYTAETATATNSTTGPQLAGYIKANNYQGGSLLIQALTVGPNETFSIERFAPIRELYVPPTANTALNPGYYTITPVSGHATIDIKNGLKQRLLRDGSPVTIDNPINTGGPLAAGMGLTLYVDRDATAGRTDPTFATGAGGFAADAQMQAAITIASTRTTYILNFHGSIWGLDSFRTNGSIT